MIAKFALAAIVAVSASTCHGNEAAAQVHKDQGAATTESFDAPATPAPSEPTTEELARKTCVVIGQDTFQVFYGGKDPSGLAPEWAVGVKCEKFTVTTDESGASHLDFTNCVIEMPDNMHGEAQKISFNTATNELTLNGTDGKDVRIAVAGAGADRILSAPQITLAIKPFPISKQNRIQSSPASYPGSTRNSPGSYPGSTRQMFIQSVRY